MKTTKLLSTAALFLAAATSIQAVVFIGSSGGLPLGNELGSDGLTATTWYTVGVNTPGNSYDLTDVKLFLRQVYRR